MNRSRNIAQYFNQSAQKRNWAGSSYYIAWPNKCSRNSWYHNSVSNIKTMFSWFCYNLAILFYDIQSGSSPMLFKTISSHLQGMARHQGFANFICVHQSRCTKINIQSGVGYSPFDLLTSHYSDVIMSMMASLITSISIIYSTVCSGTGQRKYQSPTSLASVSGINQSLVNSPGQ